MPPFNYTDVYSLLILGMLNKNPLKRVAQHVNMT